MCAIKPISVLFGALLLASSLGEVAQANPTGREREKNRQNERVGEPVRQQVITISTVNGEVRISSVIVITDAQEVLATMTDTGVLKEDTDRVDLSSVPIIGGLFGSSKDKDTTDLVPIGNVHILGPTLAIDLRSPPTRTMVVNLPANVREEREQAGRSMDSTIREILELRPRDMSLVHHLQGSEFLLEHLQVRQEKSDQTLSRMSLGRIGIFGDPVPEGPVDKELADKIEEFERLFGEPDATAYLQERTLLVTIPDMPR